MENTEQKIEELKQHTERLEDRIKELEDKSKQPILEEVKRREFLPSYDILKVYKLIGNLPIYSTARTGTPDNGEVWLSDIGGVRKLNTRIVGVNYSTTIT